MKNFFQSLFRTGSQPTKHDKVYNSVPQDKLSKIVGHFEAKAIQERQKENPNLIFISYKTENIIIARALAEALMSMGHNVWFDEYKISLKEFGKLFWERIDEGIALRSKAVLLTSDFYWHSKYCVYEADNILNKFDSPMNIFNVGCPLHSEHEKPNKKKLLRAKTDLSPEVENLLTKLSKYQNTKWEDSINSLLKTFAMKGFIEKASKKFEIKMKTKSDERLTISQANISFDVKKWTSQNIDSLRERLPVGKQFPQWLYYNQIDDCRLIAHILESKVDKKQRRIDFTKHAVDDKEVFEENLSAAESYLRASGTLDHNVQIIGVHLVLLLNLSHFAITYFIQDDSRSASAVLMRKYVLTFPSLDNKNDIEVVLTTRILSDRQIDFQKFLHYMPLFDEFVYSAEYEK